MNATDCQPDPRLVGDGKVTEEERERERLYTVAKSAEVCCLKCAAFKEREGGIEEEDYLASCVQVMATRPVKNPQPAAMKAPTIVMLPNAICSQTQINLLLTLCIKMTD